MKKTREWHVVAIVLFVVLGLSLGLPYSINLGNQASIAAAAEKASAPKWRTNSDGLVFVEVSSVDQIPPLPLFLAAKILLREDPSLAVHVGETPFRLHFPKSERVTADDMNKLQKAAKNMVRLIKELGVPAGVKDEIHVLHQDKVDFSVALDQKGIVQHVVDLVGEVPSDELKK